MKYMLLTYLDEQKWMALSEEEQRVEMAKCIPHMKQYLDAGKILDGAPLHASSSATTVRVKKGQRLLTDGPFAETREQLGGYTLIDANDLDEAIDIAAGFLGDDAWVTIEVRPVLETYQLPK